MKLKPDIVDFIAHGFGQSAAIVLELIESHIIKHPDHNGRVIRCIIFLSEISQDKLIEMIEAARADYRDVIFWAEYSDHNSKEPRRIRNFNRPFGKEMIKKYARPCRQT